MKKFWKKTEGFTLVELVVVIAILGVLAGVGTVGYSGYVKKANMAADETLLNNLNTAFAVACIENGVDHTKVSADNIVIGSDKTVDETDIVVNHAKAAAIQSAFDGYFEGGQFKVMTALKFESGKFVNADGSAYEGLTFDSALIGLVKDSAFFTAEGLGMNNLMGKVGYITNLAADLADPNTNNGAWQMLSRYNMDVIAALGIELPDGFYEMDVEEQTEILAPYYALIDDKIAALDAQGGSGIDGWNSFDENEKKIYAQKMILGNYAVLDAAKGMKNQDPAAVLNTIKTTTNFRDLILNSENEDGVALASAAYGLYTAYAYSTGNEEAISKATNDPVGLLKAMDDPNFRAYLEKDEAETDLAGYMAAMEMIDSSATDVDALSSLMLNGFTDPALLAVIQQAMK